MRTEKHYRDLAERNEGTVIELTLATNSVFAALHGSCDANDVNDEWREIYRNLKQYYGENLTTADVIAEMDKGAKRRINYDYTGTKRQGTIVQKRNAAARELGYKGSWNSLGTAVANGEIKLEIKK